MRGSRKFCQRGSNFDWFMTFFFLNVEGREDPNKTISDHHRPASKTPFEWCFAGVPMMAQHWMLTRLGGFVILRGIWTSTAMKCYSFVIFQGVGGSRPPAPPSPSGSTHAWAICLSFQTQKDYMCNIRYRDLFANFELTMNATCRDEKVDESFPGTMVINAFRGFLDEFRNSVNVKKKEKEKEKKRKKPHKKRKREKDTIVSIRGFAQESHSTVI